MHHISKMTVSTGAKLFFSFFKFRFRNDIILIEYPSDDNTKRPAKPQYLIKTIIVFAMAHGAYFNNINRNYYIGKKAHINLHCQ